MFRTTFSGYIKYKPHEGIPQRTMKISAVVGMAGWFLKVSGGQVKTCPAVFNKR
jgi:hypothetical protein